MDAFFLMIAFRFILETTCPLTFVVNLWLSLAGDISALARLTLTNYAILFSLLNLRLSLAGGISAIARLIALFYFILFTKPVAVIGRRNPHHRPVELILYFLYQPEVASRRPVDLTLPY